MEESFINTNNNGGNNGGNYNNYGNRSNYSRSGGGGTGSSSSNRSSYGQRHDQRSGYHNTQRGTTSPSGGHSTHSSYGSRNQQQYSQQRSPYQQRPQYNNGARPPYQPRYQNDGQNGAPNQQSEELRNNGAFNGNAQTGAQSSERMPNGDNAQQGGVTSNNQTYRRSQVGGYNNNGPRGDYRGGERGDRNDPRNRGRDTGNRNRTAINRQIRAPEVRLITADGEQAGVVSLEYALEQAENSGLDLVEVSAQADPPVCKIMDFGKYLFEQRKKVKNRAKRVQVKELKLRPTIDVGDYAVKTKQAAEFLQDGDKVRFVVRFRGRELSYQQHGRDILTRIAEDLKEYGAVEQSAKTEGKQMVMVLAPNKKK